jgi:hypothetical protein
MQESRDDIEPLIAIANRRIAGTVGDRVLDFRPESRDDGNGLICSSFADVIAVFIVLTEVFRDVPFRAGCEANLQGRLNYYPESRALGGRAFEHAARIAAMFKEIGTARDRWIGDPVTAEPSGSYLAVGEFARRYATAEGAWPTANVGQQELNGQYLARVRTALPISVSLILPGPA